jgi:6,7-dimethyl-8-ribityllumazine synthase
MPIYNEQNTEITFPIAVVVSRFNSEIAERLLAGSRIRLAERGFDESQITIVHVPGAVEIPLAAQKLAEQKKFDAILTLGAVIRGETDHYDYVCTMVSQGCLDVSLKFSVPVIFGVLTTDTEEQALDRVGGKHGHKGRDGVDAACEMVALFQRR